jgi:hypothetical protein
LIYKEEKLVTMCNPS